MRTFRIFEYIVLEGADEGYSDSTCIQPWGMEKRKENFLRKRMHSYLGNPSHESFVREF